MWWFFTYMKIVPFPFEFRGSVDLISHDSWNGLFYVFHPLNHFCLPHDVHILDKRIVFLPESHFGIANRKQIFEINLTETVLPYFFRLLLNIATFCNGLIFALSFCTSSKKINQSFLPAFYEKLMDFNLKFLLQNY